MAIILEFKTRPKPEDVVSQVEGQLHANVAFVAAVWRLWFARWGIDE